MMYPQDYCEDGEQKPNTPRFEGSASGTQASKGGWRTTVLSSIRGQLILLGANAVFFAILSSAAALDWHGAGAGIRFNSFRLFCAAVLLFEVAVEFTISPERFMRSKSRASR